MSRLRHKLLTAAQAFVFFTMCARSLAANDGAASLAAGGIILRHESRISMERERLTIGLRKVSVEYEFLNQSDRDITTQVAFPIPEYLIDEQNFNAPRDFPDFRVWIDGRPLVPKTDLQALVNGTNQADLLNRFGIDIIHFGGYEKSFENRGEYQIVRLPEAAQRELLAANLISSTDKHPQWAVHMTYYWSMTFPAHRMVGVRHEYTPVAGQAQIPSDYFQPEVENDPATAPSADIARAVWRLARQGCFATGPSTPSTPPNLQVSTAELAQWRGGLAFIDYVDYILTTANTWKGPIKNFELIVDENDPSNSTPLYVNFCWDAPVHRVDSRHVSTSKANFTPKHELSIFFVRRPVPEPR